jgi:hypothetical protein
MNEVKDLFAPNNTGSEAALASSARLGFADMAAHLAEADSAVADMSWDDNRRKFALEYVAALRRLSEGHDLEYDVGLREDNTVAYSELSTAAHAEGVDTHGAPTGGEGVPDPDAAIWAHSGRLAVDSFVANLIHEAQ